MKEPIDYVYVSILAARCRFIWRAKIQHGDDHNNKNRSCICFGYCLKFITRFDISVKDAS